MNRLLDLAIAPPLALGSAPLIGLLALTIRATSPGPAIFRQTRIGRHKKPFTLYKLRTMVQSAFEQGPGITASGDRRVTPLGRFLRKTKIDELPQLWNVVLGDMSLVGPRPEDPRYVQDYPDRWLPIFDVRPGITDTASLVFSDEETLLALSHVPDITYRDIILPTKIKLALEDIANASIGRDIRLLAQTVIKVLRGKSAPKHPVWQQARQAILQSNKNHHSAAMRSRLRVLRSS